jgi:6-phosphogluconolactonase
MNATTGAAASPTASAASLGLVLVGCFTTEKRAARGKGIDVYRTEPRSGAWAHASRLGDLVNPSFLVADPRHRVLYVVHSDSAFASAFAVDASTGVLTRLGQAPTGGLNGVHQALDPSGRFLVVANYGTGSVAVLPVRADGSLEPLVHCLDLAGPPLGPHRTEQAAPHPHHVVFDPSGRFLLVPDKGLDCVFVLALDPAEGRLEIVSRMAMRPGAGPRHVAFHPDLPFLFVVNELDSSVATCRWNGETGVLTPLHVTPALPPDFFGVSTAAAIVITPCGRFVFASNRGQDGVARFAFDITTEQLRPLGWTPAGGRDPRFMTLSPQGDKLLVANEQSDSIVTFGIDPATGALGRIGPALPSASPCTIAFL